MIKGNALGRIVSGEHALDLFSEQTWLEVLAAFENAKDELIALLPEAEPEDAQEQDPTDDAVRSCATPAMWEQVSPEDMQSLDRLTQDIKRMADPLGQLYKKTPKPDEDLRSEQFLFRALTLMLSCPVPVVRNTIGEAARRGDDTLFYACEMVHNLVPEFLRALMREGRPIYLQFDSDQYGCMAQFVQMSARGRLRAATARRWFYNGKPIELSLVDGLIHAVLQKIILWDRARNEQVATSNRMVAEVRGALLRMYPYQSCVRGEEIDGGLVGIDGLASAVSTFAEKWLTIDTAAWTASSVIFAAWIAWCNEREAPPGSEEAFFRALNRWGGGRIRRTKPRPALVPGYEGLALVAGR